MSNPAEIAGRIAGTIRKRLRKSSSESLTVGSLSSDRALHRKRVECVSRQQFGFTVIEILVALSLLAFVILAASRAFITTLTLTARGNTLTVASALGAKKLEEIRSRVESQRDQTAWRRAFCQIAAEPAAAGDPAIPFPPPDQLYAYRVLVNESAVAASHSQQEALLPAWSIEQGRRYPWSSASAYTRTCEEDEDPLHENRLRWVTVEVFFQGGDHPLVRMTTAVIRSAYH